MELKYFNKRGGNLQRKSSNRTFMELKFMYLMSNAIITQF